MHNRPKPQVFLLTVLRSRTGIVRLSYGFVPGVNLVVILVRMCGSENRDPFIYLPFKIEPRHEKTCSCHMLTTKAQISLRIRSV